MRGFGRSIYYIIFRQSIEVLTTLPVLPPQAGLAPKFSWPRVTLGRKLRRHPYLEAFSLLSAIWCIRAHLAQKQRYDRLDYCGNAQANGEKNQNLHIQRL